jgi:xanthine dehydrogenase large subunit
MTVEELKYDREGRLLTDALATYKVPDLHFAPRQFNLHFLRSAGDGAGPKHSKAIGEPPFLYGIGLWFALEAAMEACRPDMDSDYTAPLSPERILLRLYPDAENDSSTDPDDPRNSRRS